MRRAPAIDAYLGPVSPGNQPVLRQLRKTSRSLVADSEEWVESYSV